MDARRHIATGRGVSQWAVALLLLCLPILAAAQEVMLSCHFDDGLPTGWRHIRQLPATMEPDTAGCATVAGWMITPAFNVTSEETSLQWIAREGGTGRSSYAVLLSTVAGGPETFDTLHPLFTATATQEWEHHTVSLGRYHGRRVAIAFRLTGTEPQPLLIDDVEASAADLQLAGIPTNHYAQRADIPPLESLPATTQGGGETPTLLIGATIALLLLIAILVGWMARKWPRRASG